MKSTPKIRIIHKPRKDATFQWPTTPINTIEEVDEDVAAQRISTGAWQAVEKPAEQPEEQPAAKSAGGKK